MIEKPRYVVSSSPQIHSNDKTSKIMWTFFLMLLPPSIWGVIVFGFSALLILVVSVATALLTEFLLNLIVKKSTLFDGSAAITGLLVGMNMPPEVPLYIPICSVVFAIAVVKWAFGGLGKNWANPAIAGRLFAFFSWAKPMTTWKTAALPGSRPFFYYVTSSKNSGAITSDLVSSATTSATVATTAPVQEAVNYDLLSGATPLSMLKEGCANISELSNGETVISNSVDMIHAVTSSIGYHISNIDIKITEFFNNIFHLNLKSGYFDPLLGLTPGCIGEVSAIILLLCGVVLLARKIITWHIPVAFIGSFAFLMWMFDGLHYGSGLFSTSPYYQVVSGGLLLGAIFMATDLVTSPISALGMIIFGVGCGVLTFLVRFLGNFPEGVSLAILFMNILTPLLDKYINPKKFGVVKKAAAKLKEEVK